MFTEYRKQLEQIKIFLRDAGYIAKVVSQQRDPTALIRIGIILANL
jgi:hypothetical protein